METQQDSQSSNPGSIPGSATSSSFQAFSTPKLLNKKHTDRKKPNATRTDDPGVIWPFVSSKRQPYSATLHILTHKRQQSLGCAIRVTCDGLFTPAIYGLSISGVPWSTFSLSSDPAKRERSWTPLGYILPDSGEPERRLRITTPTHGGKREHRIEACSGCLLSHPRRYVDRCCDAACSRPGRNH